MANCATCATELKDGAAFCTNCGNAQVEGVSASAPASPEASSPPPVAAAPPPSADAWSQPAASANDWSQPASTASSTAVASTGPSTENWMMFCHLSALAGMVCPFGNILGPLAIWLAKRSDLPQVDVEGKEALNFQISMTIYMLVAGALTVLLIGLPLLVLIVLGDLVLTVVAALQAAKGITYRYPLTMRFIK
jgi:uncharacterized Tic20 family protein